MDILVENRGINGRVSGMNFSIFSGKNAKKRSKHMHGKLPKTADIRLQDNLTNRGYHNKLGVSAKKHCENAKRSQEEDVVSKQK